MAAMRKEMKKDAKSEALGVFKAEMLALLADARKVSRRIAQCSSRMALSSLSHIPK